MATHVDLAFAAGHMAWHHGVLRRDNPFAAGPSVADELLAWAWTLGWLRAADDATRAESQALRAELQSARRPAAGKSSMTGP